MRTEHVKLGEDGRIVIPASTRQEMGLSPGDTLVLESDGVCLQIRTYQQVIREVQSYFKQFAKPGVSVVDELMAERRRDFELEEAKWKKHEEQRSRKK